jgi:uncharacterized protein with PQ loop repeat
MMLVVSMMELILTGAKKMETFSQKNPVESRAYMLFGFIVCVGALMLLNNGRSTFSSLMTFSVAVQQLGYWLMLNHVIRGGMRSTSMWTLGISIIVLTFRLYATCLFDAYVPGDWSGDYIYQLIEAISLATLITAVVKKMMAREDESSREDGWCSLIFIGLAGFAAYHVHPNMNDDFEGDVSWTFSVYLETFAMMPQLFLFARDKVDMESMTGLSHFIACTFVSKAVMVRFFMKNYVIMKTDESKVHAGLPILGAYTIQCLLLADFMYIYVRNVRRHSIAKVVLRLIRGFAVDAMGMPL